MNTYIDCDNLRKELVDLNTHVGGLESSIKKMNSLNNSLQNYWSDGMSNSFFTSLNTYKKNMDKLISCLNDYSNILNNAISEFSDLDMNYNNLNS